MLVLSVGCGYLGLDGTPSSFQPINLRGFGEFECSRHFCGLLVVGVSTLGPWAHPLGSPKCFSTLCVPKPFFAINACKNLVALCIINVFG